ncbi:MAG: hypothetical protein HY553_11555 [Elusimicrobia bacterium]|nr:hypothetical protein [Elusimicrobiota bacterium]
MMKGLLMLGLSFGLAAPAAAVGSAEVSAASAVQAFGSLGAFKLRHPIRALEARTAAPGASLRKVAAGQSKYVTLRGHVYVSGDAYVGNGRTGYVWITVSGNTQLQDNEGRYLSGFVTVSHSDTYYVNGSWVNGWARPSAYVTLYKGGRYVGTIRVEGSIPVNGYNNGGWVRVSGSGWIEGSGYITEPDEPQAP